MKKQTKKLLIGMTLIMLMMTVLCFGASAEERFIEGYYEYSVLDGEALIWSVDNSISGDVVVPETLGGYPVSAIYHYAFSNLTEITSIIIPDCITTLGSHAFEGCTNLTSIDFGNGITCISEYTCSNCPNLSKITFPDKVTLIDDFAFDCCTSLVNVKIPDSVTRIDRAFNECINLKEVILPEGVTKLYGTFAGCTSLENITLPKSMTSINDAFENCVRLEKIVIPDGVTEISSATFTNCRSLTSITIPDDVIELGYYDWDEYGPFKGCANLSEVKLGSALTIIGSEAFSYCINLKSIIIPEKVTYIGPYAFKDCVNLTSITLPKSLTKIQSAAFDQCAELSDVYYEGTEEEWKLISIGHTNDNLTNATIHYNASPVHTHSYTATTSLPTCTEQGYTAYTCACGDTYTADYVAALGHKDANGDYVCDNGCGYEFEKPAPEDPSADCSHLCHKSGFMSFIWKILRFFFKLFKTNPVCECGAAHY